MRMVPNTYTYIQCRQNARYFMVQQVVGIARAERDGTHAETRFRLSPKRTSPFKSVGASVSRLLAAEVCASALVMLNTSRSEVA